MKRIRLILGVAGAAMLIASCNNVDFKKTSAGVPYKNFGGESKDSLPANGFLKFNVIQRVKDSVLYSSYKEGAPQYLPVAQLLGATPRGYTDLEGNFFEILRKARKGDSLYIVFSADSFLTKPSPMPLPFKKGDEIVTTIKVMDIFKNEADYRADFEKANEARIKKAKEEADRAQAAEAGVISDYVAKNNLTQKTPSGVYYQVLREGQGPMAKNGQQVDINYRGTFLNGEKFDEGTFPLTIGSGGAVAGFDEAARLLNKGRKIKVLIPSQLGYGERGQGPIKPFTPLVFEMEAADIKAGAPQQPGAPPITIDTANRQR